MRIPWQIFPVALRHRSARILSLRPRHLNCHAMEWDGENGVWKGDLAPVIDEVPDPLYVFGTEFEFEFFFSLITYL